MGQIHNQTTGRVKNVADRVVESTCSWLRNLVAPGRREVGRGVRQKSVHCHQSVVTLWRYIRDDCIFRQNAAAKVGL